MKSIIAGIAVATALVGCANLKPTLPEGYSGPTASIKDSAKRYSSQKADMFYVATINGDDIESSLIRTRRENEGKMLFMRVNVLKNRVPAQPLKLNVVGKTEYAAPILAMTNTVYLIKGLIEFTPEADKDYLVRGELGENYSAIWIEEEQSHVIMGKKIEITGSAKQGMFDK